MEFIFRNQGGIGAFLGEYENGIIEFIQLCSEVSSQQLIIQIDYKIKDKDRISIQSILAHFLSAMYSFIIAIRKHLCEEVEYV